MQCYLLMLKRLNVHENNTRTLACVQRFDIFQTVECDQNLHRHSAGEQSLRSREDRSSRGGTEEEYQITHAQCVIRINRQMLRIHGHTVLT